MQITHKQARSFIQFNAERALSSSSQAALQAHLATCGECRLFAEEIQEVHSLLGPVMKKHWGKKAVPLPIPTLFEKRASRSSAGTLLVMRSLVIVLVFVAFAFSARQFMLTGAPGPSFTASSALPAPTPSAYTTSTGLVDEDCAVMEYTVQRGDTLASLAHRFAVSEEKIIALNGLKNETLTAGQPLQIPACNFTPTGTVIATRYTRTGTPMTSPVPSTPGPGG